MHSGIPWTANILSNFGITTSALVLLKSVNFRNREYRSSATSKYSPNGRGPKNSIWGFPQGLFGMSHRCNGSVGAGLPTA